jgi:HSP20 family protein
MAIQRWDPLREGISLRDAMNTLFQESFIRPTGLMTQEDYATLPLDVSETEDAYVVRTSLPGVSPEDVQITVQGNTLIIRGESKAEEERKGEQWHLRERRFGRFQRSVTLPAQVSADRAEAQYENGVLTLTLPKAEEAKPRQIKIGGAASPQIGQGQQSKK